MKKLYRISASLLALFLIFSSVITARAVISPSSDFYVSDYTQSDVISSATEKYIIAMNDQLEKLTGAQVVIAAVDFLDGSDIEDYSYNVYNEWKIGSAELNNGLLILLVIGEQNYWGVQGAGIRDALTSSLIANYLNTYLEPYFADAKYDKGVRAVFDAFIDWYSKYYGVTVSVSEELSKPPAETAASSSSSDSTDEQEEKPDRLETILAAGFTLGKIAKWFLISIAVIAVAAVIMMLVRKRRIRMSAVGAAAGIKRARLFRRRRARRMRDRVRRGAPPDGQYSYVRPKNGTTTVRPGYSSGFSEPQHRPSGPNTHRPPNGGNVRPGTNKYDNLFRFNGVPGGPSSAPRSNMSHDPINRSSGHTARPGAPRPSPRPGRSGFGGFSGGIGRSGFSKPGASAPRHGGGGFTRGGGAGRKR